MLEFYGRHELIMILFEKRIVIIFLIRFISISGYMANSLYCVLCDYMRDI